MRDARARHRAPSSRRRRAGRRVPVGRHRLGRAGRPDARCRPARHSDRDARLRGVSRATPRTRRRSPRRSPARYGTRHTTRAGRREAEFRRDLPRILDAMDQPTIDGINTWFVSKAARELGLKVAISGLGGDELFGGYPSFRDVPRWVATVRGPLATSRARRRARVMLRPLGRGLGVGAQGRRHARVWRQLGRRLSAAPRPLHAVGARTTCSSATLSTRACAASRRCSSSRRELGPRRTRRLRQGRDARSLALHAQPAPARHRLGQHGALARGARAAGR